MLCCSESLGPEGVSFCVRCSSEVMGDMKKGDVKKGDVKKGEVV